MVHAIQEKARVDEISHMDGIHQARMPAGKDGCNPRLHDIMAALDADDVILVLLDDPCDLEKGTYPAQPGLFNRINLAQESL